MTDYNFAQILPYSSYPPKWESGQLYCIDFEYDVSDGSALAASDTITTPSSALPDEGIRIVDVEISHPELDSNTTPTGTYDIGDSDDVDRFLDGAVMAINGVTTAGYLVYNRINVEQTLTSGVVSAGSGYLYASGTSPQLVLTVASSVATGVASGIIRMRVWFYCTGEE
jgi:hypothetical protein